MTQLLDSTPLIAVDAVSFDTETTGLDVRNARIVEFGAVTITKGRRADDGVFTQFVNPGIPIPPSASKVHGIEDETVAGAPDFATAHAAFADYCGRRLLIGFSVGFDLAILAAETERHGVQFRQPRALCVRLLARIALPHIPEAPLEALADHLGVSTEGRHTAWGDARMAADTFVKMAPLLAERGVRTVAEAERACAGLSDQVSRHQDAGWVEPFDDRSGAARALPVLGAVDPFAFRHSVGEAMARNPVIGRDDMTVDAAIKLMTEKRISSLFVHPAGEGGAPVTDYGILTERDVMRLVARRGALSLTEKAGRVATRPLQSIASNELAYRAISLMNRKRIRHLAVNGPDGRLTGVVSARDFLQLRSSPALNLHNDIVEAANGRAMAAAWARLPAVASAMLSDAVDARLMARIISDEIGAMTRRAAELAEAEMAEAGAGAAPCDYALIILGSGGRGESLLAADQDNAIVFAEGDPGGPQDIWFQQLGEKIARALDIGGVPLCKGGVMARNDAWRGSMATWKNRINGWIGKARPQDILHADIFFDLAHVHGAAGLSEELRSHALAAAAGDVAMLKLMAEESANVPASTTMFGGFKTVDGRIDLKRHGLFPIVSGARVLALRHSIAETSTSARLEALARRETPPNANFFSLREAHKEIVKAMLEQQIRDTAAGVPLSNAIDPKALDQRGTVRLKRALATAAGMPEVVRANLF